MPGVSLHFVLADRALERWRAQSAVPPFDTRDPASLDAYFTGVMGPDLGYMPGGDRVLSDFAHCLLPAELTRILVRTARTDRERAFAWGWVTHVLGDQLLHPLIGRGVGEVLHDDPSRFVDGSSAPLTHLRVEIGVDAWFAHRHPKVPKRRIRGSLNAEEMAFIVRAYNATYGAAFDGERLSRSMRLVPIRTGQALATMGLVHALMDEGPVLPPMPSLRWALKAAYGTGVLRSHALAYLTPVQPAPWLLVAIAEIMEVHAEQCAGAVFDGGAAIEDRNLDTGKLLRTQIRHPGTRNALAALATMLEETRALLHPGVGEVASVDAETLLALPGAGAPHPEAEPARVAVGRLEA